MTVIDAIGLDIEDQALEDELEAYVGPPGGWAEKRDIQIKILNHFKVKTHHRVLEIGSGSMRGGAPLIKYLDEGRYIGVEASAERFGVGQRAINYFGLDHKSPQLLCDSAFAVDRLPPGKIDLVWAFQVIPHMEEEIFKAFIRSVGYHLKPKGKAIFSIRMVSEGPDFAIRGAWQEFPTTNIRRDYLERLADDEGLKMTFHGKLADWQMASNLGGARNSLVKLRRL